MQARADLVERGAVGRRVADQHQRRQPAKRCQPLGDLRLAVFARRIERRGAGVAQAGDVLLAHLHVLPVEIVQAEARAHAGDLSADS